MKERGRVRRYEGADRFQVNITRNKIFEMAHFQNFLTSCVLVNLKEYQHT